MAEGGYINIRVPNTSSVEIEEEVTSMLPTANTLTLNKTALVKSNYSNVVSTNFTELTPPPSIVTGKH